MNELLVGKTMEEIKEWFDNNGYDSSVIEAGANYYYMAGYQDPSLFDIVPVIPDQYTGEETLYNVYIG